MKIAGAHPALRQDAVSQMCRALIADQRMAQIVLSAGTDSLRAEPRNQVCYVTDGARSSLITARLSAAMGGCGNLGVRKLRRVEGG